jgi:hypothetical protein
MIHFLRFGLKSRFLPMKSQFQTHRKSLFEIVLRNLKVLLIYKKL